MSNLIPVKRPDKNGHIVTRWVKPNQADNSRSRVIPSPAPKTESLTQKRARLLDTLDFAREFSSGLVAVVEAQISFMSPKMLDAAFEQLEKHPNSWRVNTAVRAAINRWAQNERKDDLIKVLPFVGVETVWDKHLKPSPLGSGRSYAQIREGVVSSINALRPQPSVSEAAGIELRDEDVDRAVLAAYAAAALDMHNVNKSRGDIDNYLSWGIYQTHGALVGVFEEFPDRLDEMIDYVHENGDDGALRQYLRGDHISLSDGAL